jgi:hypothetical protein
VKRIEVDLPEGFSLNPSAANGLSSCDRVGFKGETLLDRGCSDGSKIGQVAIASPIFSEPLSGSVFFGGEAGEPFAGSFRLYVIARSPPLGLVVKLQALLRLDPESGRVTVVADDLPPLPLSSLKLSFPPGPRALLATPNGCGTRLLETGFTPFADPATTFKFASRLSTAGDPAGSGCSEGPRPFHPVFSAGTLNNAAAAYSPFNVRLSRDDGEAELGGLAFTLPPGLVAAVAGVPACPAAALEAAAARSATAEVTNPSCPPATQVGRSLIGAGVGPVLNYVPGSLYLAGPFRGAPFSLAAITPARFGPLDLGTVVRHLPLRVDPHSGQASVGLEPAQRLPSILEGVVLHLRDLRLYFDRAGFMVNPSTCAPETIVGAAQAGDGGATHLAQRFQAAGCSALPFKPSLALALSGALRRNGHPALRATIRSNGRQARISAAAITLPPGQLLDIRHVRALCPRSLPAAHCPPASRVGRVRIRSPLLGEPLQGPVFLRVPVRGLPALVADLHAGSLELVLRGHAAAAAGRVRLVLQELPDLPLEEAQLLLDGGSRGLFVNSEKLCATSRAATAILRAHSGKSRHLRPRWQLQSRC